MFLKIHYYFHKIYFRFFTGFSLFFIAMSPFSDSRKRLKPADEKPRAQIISQFNMGMMDQFLSGGAREPQESLSSYPVYLAQASPEHSFFTKNSHKMFLPLTNTLTDRAETKADTRVLYGELLDAFLNRVETMIQGDKDYVTALRELDKISILEPANPRLKDLKDLLTREIEKKLSEKKWKKSHLKLFFLLLRGRPLL